MARGYVSIGGKAYNGKKAYLVKGKRTYKGKKAYIVKGSKTFLSWSGTESGEIIVTSSGVVTIPEYVTEVDIFCVGGGGGAGGWISRYTETMESYVYGGGGGGGYTATAFGVEVTPGETLTVTIGAGGKTGRSYDHYKVDENTSTSGSTSSISAGGAGGQTSIKRGSEVLCSAEGGSGGKPALSGSSTGGSGGSGGSGGCGGGAYHYSPASGVIDKLSYYGGSDGGDGDAGGSINNLSVSGGTGQGYTTRAFEEITGTLYSNGGDGAGNTANALANSGDGANVALGYGIDSSGYVNRYGGSGIVIIRWKDQEI